MRRGSSTAVRVREAAAARSAEAPAASDATGGCHRGDGGAVSRRPGRRIVLGEPRRRRAVDPPLLGGGVGARGVDRALLRQPNYVKAGTVIEDMDRFDAAFFGCAPREAEVMDPQHRVFLECAWEALEHAGQIPDAVPGSIGVFAGAGLVDVCDPQHPARGPTWSRRRATLQVTMNNEVDSLASTVSYKLNLRGPSFAVQTFCSTSLVAVHLACQSLLAAGLRRGARGRRGDQRAARRGLPLSGGRDRLAGRALPDVRCAGAGLGDGQRRGRGGVEAAGGRARGRRRDLRGDPRVGGEQRRGAEGRVYGAGRGRADDASSPRRWRTAPASRRRRSDTSRRTGRRRSWAMRWSWTR